MIEIKKINQNKKLIQLIRDNNYIILILTVNIFNLLFCFLAFRQPWISSSNSMTRWNSMNATMTQVAHHGTWDFGRFSPMKIVGAKIIWLLK